jgi:hypothetical protein
MHQAAAMGGFVGDASRHRYQVEFYRCLFGLALAVQPIVYVALDPVARGIPAAYAQKTNHLAAAMLLKTVISPGKSLRTPSSTSRPR